MECSTIIVNSYAYTSVLIMNDCTIDLLLYIHDNDDFCDLCEIVNHFDKFSLCVSYFALSSDKSLSPSRVPASLQKSREKSAQLYARSQVEEEMVSKFSLSEFRKKT